MSPRKKWKLAYRAHRAARSNNLIMQMGMAQASPFSPYAVQHFWVNGRRVKDLPPGKYDFSVRDCRPYGFMRWLWDLEVTGIETHGSC